MAVCITISGVDYELPKFTVDVAERLKDIGDITDIREKATAMYDFVSHTVNDSETVADILDGEDVKSIDLAALCNLYQVIDNAYADSMSVERDKRLGEQMESAKSAIDTLEKAHKVIAANGGGSKRGRQVFSGVA